MQKLKVWIYRPDLRPHPKVDPDLCYDLKGQNFRDWQRDEQTVYDYKVDEIRRNLKEAARPHKHYLEDYWR